MDQIGNLTSSAAWRYACIGAVIYMKYDELLSINFVDDEIAGGSAQSSFAHTPYRDEIRLFSCIEQGDLNRLISEIKRHADSGIFVGTMSESSLMQRKYMAVSSITLATRYAIQGGLGEEEAYSFSDKFIKTIDGLDSDTAVMGCLLQKIYELTELVAKAKHEMRFSPHVRKCVSYVNQNISEKITVCSVAKALDLSADYISHLFKKETGINLSAYILKSKLNAAKSLLWEGMSSTEVCFSLGFCSQSHFIAAFKKEFGKTPGEFSAAVKPKA